MRLFSAEILRSKIVYAVFALAPLVAMAVADEQQKAPPTTAQIAAWVRDLGAAQFDVREQAEKSLLAAGEAAIEPLAAILDSKDPEVRLRARRTHKAVSIADEAIAIAELAKVGVHCSKYVPPLERADHERSHDSAIGFHRGGPHDHLIGGVSIRRNKTIRDDDLRWLRKFPAVRQVYFTDSAIGDKAMKHLAGMSLDKLDLSGTNVTDAGLEHLASLRELRYLAVGRTAITGTGFKKLTVLKRLSALSFYGNAITEAGAEAISNLVQLDAVGFFKCPVTDTMMRHFGKMQDLRSFQVENANVTDIGVGYLSSLSKMRALNLSHNPVTGESIPMIAKLPALNALTLCGTKVTVESLHNLRVSDSLREIRIQGIGADASSVQLLQKSLPNVSITSVQ